MDFREIPNWNEPTSDPSLDEREVVLWRVDLAKELEREPHHRAVLNELESARANRFRRCADRQKFSASRAILKRLLGHYTGVEARSIDLLSSQNGKPSFPGIFFNISHSKRWALLAFSRQTVLGVDLEWKERDLNFERIARQYFSCAEKDQLRSASDATEKRDLFFTIWTRKEAYVKALGSGMFREFETCSAPLGSQILSAKDCKPAWWIVSFRAAPGYAASLCQSLPKKPLRFLSWTRNSITA